MNRHFTLALTLGLASIAGAQSRSSFHNVTDMNSVFVTTSNGGLTLEVLLGGAPTLKFEGQTYNITDVFGVWALDNNDDFSATGTSQNGWSFNTNTSGTGGIFGWKTNPNAGVKPNGGPLTFNFSSAIGQSEALGFHMRFDRNFGNTCGNTAFVTGTPTTAVPGPAPVLAYVLGMGAIRARRRRAASA